jgi:RNA polymerase sigma factor (sigma-70 family)
VVTDEAVRRAVEVAWRLESPKIVARLTRLVGNLATAEDLAHDAFVAALRRWPSTGVPDNPGAWLATVARYQAVDHIRRNDRLAAKTNELGVSLSRQSHAATDDLEVVDDDSIGDDLLGMILMTCHPVLSPDARVALTLRVVGGLRTDEIARAFLVAEQTVAQRIVRAKRTLAAAGIPYEIPGRTELRERLVTVLEVVLLIFNEGYAATAGDDWMRPALCEDALRLGRILADLVPHEPEVHGLVALMEIQASRTASRVSPTGDPVLLLDQDRGRWNQLLIRRGFAALAQARRLGGPFGPYVLQAAIAACHARAATAEDTDWAEIVALYDALVTVMPSPIVELNRAVAVSRAFGAAAGLELVDRLVDDAALERYHLLPSVRADLLAQLGRVDEARSELTRAAAMTRNERERALLQRRAEDLGGDR